METILVRPQTASELDFFKEFFRKVRAEVEYVEEGGHLALPAAMTVEELRAEVAEAEEEFRAGKGIRHEDLMEELKAWI